VVPGDGGDADGAQKTLASSGVWSTSLFVSRGEAERRLEWTRRQELRVMVTGIESLRDRTSGGHQPVHKEEGSRVVPKMGCRVTSFRRNLVRTAADSIDSDEAICRPGGVLQRGRRGKWRGEEGEFIGAGRRRLRQGVKGN
jgi:hypothetical protein